MPLSASQRRRLSIAMQQSGSPFLARQQSLVAEEHVLAKNCLASYWRLRTTVMTRNLIDSFLEGQIEYTIKRKAVPIRSTSLPPQGPAPTRPLPPLPLVSRGVPMSVLVAEKSAPLAVKMIVDKQEVEVRHEGTPKKLSTKLSRHFKLPSLTSISSMMSTNSSSTRTTIATTVTSSPIEVGGNKDKPLPALPLYKPVQAAQLSPDFILNTRPRPLRVPGRFGARTSTLLDANSTLRLTRMLEPVEEAEEEDTGCCGLPLTACFSTKKVRNQRAKLIAVAPGQGDVRRLRSRRYAARTASIPMSPRSMTSSFATSPVACNSSTTAKSRRRSRTDFRKRASFDSKRTSVYSLQRIATMLEDAIPFTLDEGCTTDKDWQSNATSRAAWDGRYLPLIATGEPHGTCAKQRYSSRTRAPRLSHHTSTSSRTQSHRRLTRQQSVAVRVQPADLQAWKRSGLSVYRGVERSQELRLEGLVRAGVRVV
jgi:hypothetical protein